MDIENPPQGKHNAFRPPGRVLFPRPAGRALDGRPTPLHRGSRGKAGPHGGDPSQPDRRLARALPEAGRAQGEAGRLRRRRRPARQVRVVGQVLERGRGRPGLLRRDLRVGPGGPALRQRDRHRLAHRLPGHARHSRSLHLPHDPRGAGDRRLPAGLRGRAGQAPRSFPAPAAQAGGGQGPVDGLLGEGGVRIRILPLPGDAGVGAGEGVREPDAALARDVRLFLAASERERPVGPRPAGPARRLRPGVGSVPHRDGARRVRGSHPVRPDAPRRGQGGAVQDRGEGDLRAHQGMGKLLQHYVAGQVALMPAMTALIAPTVNSYKRMVRGAWSPTMATWGVENRTTALRVIPGSPASTRVEYRFAAADMNPYVAIAASVAAGLHGVQHELPLPPETTGNGYEAKGQPLPPTLRAATDALSRSKEVRELLGDAFVDHYVRTRDWECHQFESAVTKWELERYFEII